jgi:opacity protein-like surface antigen
VLSVTSQLVQGRKSVPAAVKKQGLKKHLLASVGLIALTVAGSASAADITRPLSPPAAVWNWSGLYLGGHAGYGWGRDPFTDVIFTGKAPLTGINSNGFLGGFQAGANWQAGAWVGGLEIDLSATGIKGSSSVSSTVSFAGATATTSETQTDKFDLLGSARARLGYLVWPNVLLYGTGGLAWTRFEQTTDELILLTNLQNGPPSNVSIAATVSDASWRFGWAAGAGVEARLWDSNWLARLEYLHYDFGDSGNNFSTTGAPSTTSGHLTADVVRAGLSYKFGQDWLMPGSSAYAAMPVKGPQVAALPWTWSGFYLGGHVGYGWGRDPFSDPIGSGAVVLTGVDSNGFLGGFQAGANWQRGAWVGGLEVDLSATGIKGSTSGADPAGFTEAISDKFDLLGSARARLGYLAWPNVLLYGTGGLAWTRFVQTTDQTSVGSSDTRSDPSWRFGWVAGLGAETRLWDSNWLARLEYLHYDFGDSGSFFSSSGFSTTSGHLTTDVVRGGLSYKFGQGWAGPASAANVAMPVKAPRVAALPWNWSGFYLGGHAGYGWGQDPISDELFGGKFASVPLRTGIDSNGFVGGFQTGANLQIGSWVGGLEIDLSATGIKGSSTTTAGIAVQTITDKFNLLGSARARLGYVVWPNVLLYGTGGLAWTRLNQESVSTDAGGTSGGSTPTWEFGWVAGGGGEVRLWDSNWLLRVEYLHYDFGDSFNLAETFILDSQVLRESSVTGHLTTDVVRAGLSYKFD